MQGQLLPTSEGPSTFLSPGALAHHLRAPPQGPGPCPGFPWKKGSIIGPERCHEPGACRPRPGKIAEAGDFLGAQNTPPRCSPTDLEHTHGDTLPIPPANSGFCNFKVRPRRKLRSAEVGEEAMTLQSRGKCGCRVVP